MNRFFKAVLLTGLFVGTTDLLYAFTSQWMSSGKFADHMLKGIASVAVGRNNAFPGNDWIAFLGLFFHYFIAFAFTLFFFWVFPRVKFLRFNKYLIGILYGIFVNVVFEQVILPLLIPRWSFSLPRAYINWICFGILFGIPVAWNAYRYYKVPKYEM
ncbi:MAG TPA: hypothetical protein VL727_08765 [Puia sp.]|jgi:hypothetical protein|nr:hypothetical protein [Puia sp.]